jgi:hydrogenase/urease accessory protein HupE
MKCWTASLLRFLGLAVLCLEAAGSAGAHPLAPSLFALREIESGRFAVTWKTPRLAPTGVRLEPVLPAHCHEVEASPRYQITGSSLGWIQQVDCGERGLVGATLSIRGLPESRTGALLRVELADGRRIDAMLHSGAPSLVVPARASPLAVGATFLGLGFEHILSGSDHLVFLVGLLLLMADRRRLLLAVTAFTAGHCVTLCLAALDLLVLPQGPVEVGIAASIMILAAELARGRGAGRESRLRRSPWAMTFAFGLLHGLGFAGALRSIGLPGDAIGLALGSFNLGIELGQLAFIAAILLLAVLGRRLMAPTPLWARGLAAYGIGSLAAFWCLQRLALLPV